MAGSATVSIPQPHRPRPLIDPNIRERRQLRRHRPHARRKLSLASFVSMIPSPRRKRSTPRLDIRRRRLPRGWRCRVGVNAAMVAVQRVKVVLFPRFLYCCNHLRTHIWRSSWQGVLQIRYRHIGVGISFALSYSLTYTHTHNHKYPIVHTIFHQREVIS